MYNSGFVASIKINGKSVEENGNKIIVPFNSEYVLCLKNRNDRKAVIRVYIDGEEVTKCGRLIMDANSNIQLERYVDDLNSGKKFKFVSVADGRVTDKNESENGWIEVRCNLVKPVLNNVIVHEEHIYHHPRHDWYPYYWRPYFVDTTINPTVFGSSITCNATGGAGGQMTANFTSSNASVKHDAYINDNHLVEEAGATVKGSHSSQKFSFAYVGELESLETCIRFQLIGTSEQCIYNKYLKTHCTGCGKRFDTSDNYCSVCGIKK